MIYEDGDGFCEVNLIYLFMYILKYMSEMLEMGIAKYRNLVKFGRINRETAYSAL